MRHVWWRLVCLRLQGMLNRKAQAMTKNATAISRGAVLAKVQLTHSKKKSEEKGIIKVDKPNRAQRRAHTKQTRAK